MKRKSIIVVFALILVVLVVSTLSAAGEITLESLAAAGAGALRRGRYGPNWPKPAEFSGAGGI